MAQLAYNNNHSLTHTQTIHTSDMILDRIHNNFSEVLNWWVKDHDMWFTHLTKDVATYSYELRTCIWLTIMEYMCHKWSRICSTCRKHYLVLSSFMTYHGFVTRLIRRVPLEEQQLIPFPGHLSSPPIFSGVRAARSLVLCVCFNV